MLIREKIKLKYEALLSVGNTAFERKQGVFAFVHMLLAAEKRYHDVSLIRLLLLHLDWALL